MGAIQAPDRPELPGNPAQTAGIRAGTVRHKVLPNKRLLPARRCYHDGMNRNSETNRRRRRSHPLWLLWGALLCFGPSLVVADRPRDKRPNIVFVLADDLGWAELGCYGNHFNETPHLDQLAADGVRFTAAYAAAPVCSPYRAALLTGRHPVQTGILDYLRPNSANALSTTFQTLAERLREAGYHTGMIGKWHLTGYDYHNAEYEVRPADHGFAWNTGSEVKGVGNGANFWPYRFRDQPVRWLDFTDNRLGEDEFLVDRMNLEAVDFIKRNATAPFFLYLSHYATHSILHGKPELVKKYIAKHPPGASTRTRCYLCQDRGLPGDPLHHWAGDHNPHLAAMLESIDDGIGQIRRTLTDLGLADNTIIVFSSDNGGETGVTSNHPLRGGKSQLFEGGIRVPQIVCWPDRLPAGQACSQPTINTDFAPTLLEAAGLPSESRQSDGISMLASWCAPQQQQPERELFWHYPLDRPHFLGGTSAAAIRRGDWKLIHRYDTGERHLFHLSEDIGEQHDLATTHTDVADRLQHCLTSLLRQQSARIPSPPVLRQTGALLFADHFSSGRASERWSRSSEWTVEDDVLHRVSGGTDSTRLFLKDADFGDVVIRFDFRLDQSQDVRLVTGSGGHYNSVLHIRPDHFYLQTAKDDNAPYFSFRHGECAYDFEPDRWYSMTVEYNDNQLVAHLDHEHTVLAEHPIIDRKRTYFAFQIDQHPAQIDNVQIYASRKSPQADAQLTRLREQTGQHPVAKTPAEDFSILKTNAHEWHYQRSPAYRGLVLEVERQDAELKARFPAAFRTIKELKKEVAKERKRLLAEDGDFKDRLFATYRARRAIETFLKEQHEDFDALPAIRQARELEKLRTRWKSSAEYIALVNAEASAQKTLQSTWPQLFVSEDQMRQQLKSKHEALKDDPVYQALRADRAAAWRAQEQFLLKHEPRLETLQQQKSGR